MHACRDLHRADHVVFAWPSQPSVPVPLQISVGTFAFSVTPAAITRITDQIGRMCVPPRLLVLLAAGSGSLTSFNPRPRPAPLLRLPCPARQHDDSSHLHIILFSTTSKTMHMIRFSIQPRGTGHPEGRELARLRNCHVQHRGRACRGRSRVHWVSLLLRSTLPRCPLKPEINSLYSVPLSQPRKARPRCPKRKVQERMALSHTSFNYHMIL